MFFVIFVIIIVVNVINVVLGTQVVHAKGKGKISCDQCHQYVLWQLNE